MKKSFFTLSLFLFFANALMAKPIDVETARNLASSFAKASIEMKSPVANLVYTEMTGRGTPCFYVFSLQPKGFVIISADDRTKPVLAYSTESNFMPDRIQEGVKTFFDNYKAGLEYLVDNRLEQSEEAKLAWHRLSETGKIDETKITRSVSPLLHSVWNQTDLYNDMAPEDPESVFSGHCKSGCVANAMSQIMRYWEWPRVGTGSYSYYCTGFEGTSYGTLSANFGAANYQYELMPDFLDFASTQAEIDAVALLEYHAGISVDMMYGPSASGAFSYIVPNALESYFRYDALLEIYPMEDIDQWEQRLRDNLDAAMPLYYGSNGPNGGHAYVCDGYDQNDMFHFNWGWQGFDNGYFAINNLYLTYISFPWGHEAIFDLRPNAEYYETPSLVENLLAVQGNGLSVDLSFNPIFNTVGGQPLSAIDTIVILRDGQVIEKLSNVTDSQVTYHDQVEKNATYYYSVYAKQAEKIGKVARDTVMVGSTCDIRFDLHDSGNDGWDMSFIAVLDEDGKISRRVGLMNGGEESLTLPVPSGQQATFFWTYDNTCYSQGTISQCSYEISDWADNLIYASSDTPTVGEIINYQIDCGLNCLPAFDLNGEYLWQSSDTMGTSLVWSWNGNTDDFVSFNVYRAEINGSFELIATVNELTFNYFDALAQTGSYQYKVTVSYERDGETCESEAAASEDDPDLNYVSVDVTLIAEHKQAVCIYPNPANETIYVDGEVDMIMVFDALGQLLYSGSNAAVDIQTWNKGIYFVRVCTVDGTIIEKKIVKR